MNELKKILETYEIKKEDLLNKIREANISFFEIDLNESILKQINLTFIEYLENLIPSFELDLEQKNKIEESIKYYKFNYENGIDLNNLLIQDDKCNQLIQSIIYLYNQSIAYREKKVETIMQELNEVNELIDKINLIIEMFNSQELIDIELLSDLLFEITNLQDLIKTLLKEASKYNLDIYIKKEKEAVVQQNNSSLEKDVSKNILDSISETKQLALTFQSISSEIKSSVEQNKEQYGIKTISDKKDEELNKIIKKLIRNIEKLCIKTSNLKDYVKLNFENEISILLEDIKKIEASFFDYIEYKELADEGTDEEIQEEYTRISNELNYLENQYVELAARLDLEIQKAIDIKETDTKKIDLDYRNWELVRYLILKPTTFKNFIKIFSEKTLNLASVESILEAIKNLVTIKDLRQCNSKKLQGFSIWELKAGDRKDSGAIRIFYVYDDEGLYIPSILFKDSDKQSFLTLQKMKDENFSESVKLNSSMKEQMTFELLEIIIERYKKEKLKEINNKNIESGEIGDDGSSELGDSSKQI